MLLLDSSSLRSWGQVIRIRATGEKPPTLVGDQDKPRDGKIGGFGIIWGQGTGPGVNPTTTAFHLEVVCLASVSPHVNQGEISGG